MDRNPSIKELLLLSGLWMVLGFALWFYLGAIHTVPVRHISDAVLGWLLGSDFYRVTANADNMLRLVVQTNIPIMLSDGSRGALAPDVNPLLYGYGYPLLFGLVMGTDTRLRDKWLQLLVGYLVVVLVQAWGVVWDALYDLQTKFGPEAAAAVERSGLSADWIYVCYQLGVLILPTLVPVLVWITMNRGYIDRLSNRTAR